MTDDRWSQDAHGLRVIGHSDLNGSGDAMHVAFHDSYAYIGHMGGDRVGTSVVDISDPNAPRVVAQIETPVGTRSHKTEVVDDILIVNYERNPFEGEPPTWDAGIKMFELSDPARPREIGFLDTTGRGVHRMTSVEMPYVYMSSRPDGFSGNIVEIADLSDPTKPEIVGRWWMTGLHEQAGEAPPWDEDQHVLHHHTVPDGDMAYTTWWDQGVQALDVSDRSAPRPVWHWKVEGSRHTHTALPIPGRDLLVVTEEAVADADPEVREDIWTVDVSGPVPMTLARFPTPPGGGRRLAGRFGPHNLHEMRPGTLIDPNRVFVTYFAAGLRVYDISDAEQPTEVAFCVPKPAPGKPLVQLNDLAVAPDGLIYVTDRVGGGLYVVEQL